MKSSTRDKMEGKLRQATGLVKEKMGQATKNPNMRDEGRVEKAAGKVQSKFGDVEKVFEK